MFVRASLVIHHDIRGCIAYLEKCLRTHPRDPYLHFFLYYKYMEDQQYAKAMDEINRALELDSTKPFWYYSRASLVLAKALTARGVDALDVFAKSVQCSIDGYGECLALNRDRTNEYCDEELDSRAYFFMAQLELYRAQFELMRVPHLYSHAMRDNNKETVKLYWEKGVACQIDWLVELCFEEAPMRNSPREFVKQYLVKDLYLCGNCEKSKPKFKCVCGEEAYCDQACQKASWKAHKKACKTNKFN
jgi:tetratricopeptide (TPR) repeat protein